MPNLLSVGAQLSIAGYVALGANFGFIPKLRIPLYGEATLNYEEYDAYARIYPFGALFFVGCGVGYDRIEGTLDTTLDTSAFVGRVPGARGTLRVQHAASISTFIVTPQIGLFKTFKSGFSVGVDVGAQGPIAPSEIEFETSVPSWVSPTIIDQVVTPSEDEVRETLRRVGRSVVPTLNLKIGWLF